MRVLALAPCRAFGSSVDKRPNTFPVLDDPSEWSVGCLPPAGTLFLPWCTAIRFSAPLSGADLPLRRRPDIASGDWLGSFSDSGSDLRNEESAWDVPCTNPPPFR